jgi:uncharacterized membrane protein
MPWTDERVDNAIGVLLRAGVTIAAFVVLTGGVWFLASHGRAHPDYHVFHGEPPDLRTVTGVLKGILEWSPLTWMQFGILLLIATPVARVAFAVFAFAAQRDGTYVVITLIVLGILLYSLSGANQ